MRCIRHVRGGIRTNSSVSAVTPSLGTLPLTIGCFSSADVLLGALLRERSASRGRLTKAASDAQAKALM